MSIENKIFKRSVKETENLPRSEIDSGVEFARSLTQKGYLSDEEVNDLVSAHERLNEGCSSEADNDLLTEWANRAEFVRMVKQRNAGLRRELFKEVGQNNVESAEDSSLAIESSIKIHLLEASDPYRVAELWREFSDNLSGLMSADPRGSQKVEAALKLANALLQARPTKEGEDSAREGIEELRKRYVI